MVVVEMGHLLDEVEVGIRKDLFISWCMAKVSPPHPVYMDDYDAVFA